MSDPADRLRSSGTTTIGVESDPLSTQVCAVCRHYECYHDEQGCFLDREGRRSRDPGILGREASKKTGAECWCPQFLSDFFQAADLIYQLGDSEALRQGTVEAINREDFRNARRLLDRYVTKTALVVRDLAWVEAIGRNIQQLPPKPNGVDASTWRGLRDEFKALADEELRLSPNNKDDRWLRAYAPDEDQSAPLGNWLLSEGLNEGFHARFCAEATRAGAALGSIPRAKPLDFWLHRVFIDLKGRKSKLLAGEGIILRICEASAIYCARLEREALEKSAREPSPRRHNTAPVSPDLKLADAAKFPTMTVREVLALLQISKASVYRYLDEGRLKRPGMNKKPGKRSKTLILTASVQKMLQEAED